MKEIRIILALLLISLTITVTGKSIDIQVKELMMTSSTEIQRTILFFVATPNNAQSDALKIYKSKSTELLKEYGIKQIGSHEIKEQLVGKCSASFISYAEFPSIGAVKDVFNSDEYKALLLHRDRAFSSLNIYVAQPGITSQAITSNKELLVTIAAPKMAEQETLNTYLQGAHALSKEYGINPILTAKFPIVEQLFGNCPASFIAFAESDKEGNLKSMFESEQYQQLISLRDKAFNSAEVFLLN